MAGAGPARGLGGDGPSSRGRGRSPQRFGQQAQQQHLEPQPRLHAQPQLLFAALELGLPVQEPRLADPARHLGQFRPQLRRHTGEVQSIGGDPGQQQVPQQAGQPLEQGGGFPAAVQQLATGIHHRHRIGGGQGGRQRQQLLLRHGTKQLPHRRGLHRCRQQAELVQQAFGIPQSSLGPLGHHMQGLRCDADLFLFGDPAQVPLQGLQRDPAEIKSLTAAQDRGQNPLGIGGGQHKHHPWRWFLQGLEQGVEGRGGKHVAFVHHVHLPARLHRREAGTLNQLADVVDAGVRGGVDLDHIQGAPGGDAAAELADTTGFGRRIGAGYAVEGTRQDAGAGGLAGASGTAEQVGRGNPLLEQGIAQGGGDGLLSHQLVKALRPVLVVQGLVGLAHGAPRCCTGLGEGAVPNRRTRPPYRS